MQIIYDSTGKVFMQGSGFPTPEGTLIYAEITVPENQYLVSMDVTKDPVEPIYAEYPKSEMTLLKEQLEQQQANLDYLMLISESEEE